MQLAPTLTMESSSSTSSNSFSPVTMDAPEPMTSDHALVSMKEGDSEVERVTVSIEKRRAGRVVITKDVRVALLKDCREIAKARKYRVRSKIHVSDLMKYRREIQRRHEGERKCVNYHLMAMIGMRNHNEQLLRVLDRAVNLVTRQQGDEDPYFHYMDFNEYYTVVESRLPWRRHGISMAFLYIFFFYLFTPILFCLILEDDGICPRDEDNPTAGWVGALYFASTTLSTVGYGDLSVDKSSNMHVGVATLYMLSANLVLIGSYYMASSAGSNPLAGWQDKIILWATGEPKQDEPLYIQLRRLKNLRLFQLSSGFLFLILGGVFANRLFLLNYADKDELDTEWTWTVSFYWAVQTATTIGYGDLDQPTNQQWFQIFYLVLSTYFVGQTLKGIVGLKDEIEQVQREYAWGRRGVSKNLIDELQPDGHDGKIDQYEFLVASLVQLGKLSSDDVTPIMNKFRSLAGDDGFIGAEQLEVEETDRELQERIEQEEADTNPFANTLIDNPFMRKYLAAPTRKGEAIGVSHYNLASSARRSAAAVDESMEFSRSDMDGSSKSQNGRILAKGRIDHRGALKTWISDLNDEMA